jgi:hypothetical protein
MSIHMKIYSGINYGYRPSSYWEDDLHFHSLFKRRMSELRGNETPTVHNQVDFEVVAMELLLDKMTKNLGKATCNSGIIPQAVGCKPLPKCRPGEVEIARISLAPPRNDSISIRARRAPDGSIRYGAADNQIGRARYRLSPKSSKRPLSLGGLLSFLAHSYSFRRGIPANLLLGYNERRNRTVQDRASLRHFTRISSAIYPQLSTCCECIFEDWIHGSEYDDIDDDF